jgi:hypothetical protein
MACTDDTANLKRVKVGKLSSSKAEAEEKASWSEQAEGACIARKPPVVKTLGGPERLMIVGGRGIIRAVHAHSLHLLLANDRAIKVEADATPMRAFAERHVD